jgi:hypothetical protein
MEERREEMDSAMVAALEAMADTEDMDSAMEAMAAALEVMADTEDTVEDLDMSKLRMSRLHSSNNTIAHFPFIRYMIEYT